MHIPLFCADSNRYSLHRKNKKSIASYHNFSNKIEWHSVNIAQNAGRQRWKIPIPFEFPVFGGERYRDIQIPPPAAGECIRSFFFPAGSGGSKAEQSDPPPAAGR
jgi:hypothetical protein